VRRATLSTLLLLFAALLAGAAAFALRERPLPPTEVAVATVRRATLVEKVRAVGHVEPVTQVKVSSNITGYLLSLAVKEGQEVERGALLAELEGERLGAVVRQNAANVQSLEAAVRLERVQQAELERSLERTRGLHQQKLATDQALEQAQAALTVSQARLDAALQRVTQAQAALDEARGQLAKTRLFAPIAGTVIKVEKKVGERIRGSELAEDLLLTLAPLSAMQVEVEVSEQDVTKVEVGQKTEVEVDALGDRRLAGEVTEIASSAVIKNRGTEMETTTFPVKVALLEVPSGLRSGMSAAVAILTRTQDDVVAVPIEAVTARLPSQLETTAEEVARKKRAERGLFSFGVGEGEAAGGPARREKPVEVVFVVQDGRAVPQRVETGISGDEELEVKAGVEAGAEVVVGPYKALSEALLPGSPLTVTTRKAAPGAAE
jgi:HlyD family secretion protein